MKINLNLPKPPANEIVINVILCSFLITMLYRNTQIKKEKKRTLFNETRQYQWRRKVPKRVCVCVGGWGGGGGGGGAHRHVMYVPSVKNQYKRVVFGYMVI